jgi:hypothetical protein
MNNLQTQTDGYFLYFKKQLYGTKKTSINERINNKSKIQSWHQSFNPNN